MLTFEPHPRTFFSPDEPSFHLTSEAAKLRLLAATGLDGAILLTFNAALAGLTAEDFVEDILVDRLAITGAVIGFNFHFGKDAARHARTSWSAQGAHHGFSVDVVPPFQHDGRRVSSGAVRDALAAGHVAEATELLGYPWFVTAQVDARRQARPDARLSRPPISGSAPTAASSTASMRCGSASAARATTGSRASAGGRRSTTARCCWRSSCSTSPATSMARRSTCAFIGWIRPEMKFDSVEDLIRRMDQDSSQARHAAGAGAGRVSAARACPVKPLPRQSALLHTAP